MKGFLSSAAVLIFAFSLVTAAYAFMLSQGDLGESALTGVVVESSRWAVEADLYDCKVPSPNGNTFKSTSGIGFDLVEVSGAISQIDKYDAGFMDMTVYLTRNYAPGVKWITPVSPNNIAWSTCDIEGDSTTHVLYEQGGGSTNMGAVTTATVSPGVYWVESTDAEGNIGYSKKITVT